MKFRRILIVEDEAIIIEMAKIMIAELEGYEVVGEAYSAKEGIEKAETLQPDLVMLDIRLGQGPDGIEVGKQLNDLGIDFVFVTSHSDPQTLSRAMIMQPMAYIVKPFDRHTLFANLELAFSRKKPEKLVLKDGYQTLVLSHNEILYLKADNVYTEIYTTGGKKVIRKTLKSLSEELGKEFIPVHRSYIVNTSSITKLGKDLELSNGAVIPVSRAHRETIRKIFSAR
jgi:two-component system, LytTR family, response regulator LytT